MFIFGFKVCSQKYRRLIKDVYFKSGFWFIAIFWLNLPNDDYHFFLLHLLMDDIHHFGYKQQKSLRKTQGFFSQICQVGGLAIIQKMAQPNLARGQREKQPVFQSPQSTGAIQEHTVEIWRVQLCFPRNMANQGPFFQKNRLNGSQLSFGSTRDENWCPAFLHFLLSFLSFFVWRELSHSLRYTTHFFLPICLAPLHL